MFTSGGDLLENDETVLFVSLFFQDEEEAKSREGTNIIVVGLCKARGQFKIGERDEQGLGKSLTMSRDSRGIR